MCTNRHGDNSDTMKTIDQKRDLEGEITTRIDDRKVDITFFTPSNLSSRAGLCQSRTIPMHWNHNMNMWEKQNPLRLFHHPTPTQLKHCFEHGKTDNRFYFSFFMIADCRNKLPDCPNWWPFIPKPFELTLQKWWTKNKSIPWNNWFI